MRGAGGEATAGAGLGLLVGLLLGLSVSEVVGAALASLTALVAVFLGLRQGEDPTRARPVRVAAFGFTCALAVLFGVFVRANNLLVLSPDRQVAAYAAAGFPIEQARQMVAYRDLGLLPADAIVADPKRIGPARDSVLFNDAALAACAHLRRFGDAPAVERLRAFDEAGPDWARLAAAVRSAQPEARAALAGAAFRLACGD